MGSDSDISGKSDLLYQPKTKFQKFVAWVSALVFFALACFTIYTLLQALQEVTRKDLRFDENPPEDRCIAWFDKVTAWSKEQPKTTRVLYDFAVGKALVRVCANLTRATVVDALGASKEYNPWAAQTDCDVIGNAEHQQLFLQNCEFGGGFDKPYPPCQSILDYAPKPLGFHFRGWAVLKKEGSNRTLANGTIIKRGKCAIQVNRDPDIADCTESYVGAFRDIQSDVAAIMYAAVMVPFAVMIWQFLALWSYARGGWKAEDGHLCAFAVRGVPGGLYMIYFWMREGQEVEIDGKKVHRGEFPDVRLNCWTFLVCVIQDIVEGIAAPLISVLGCSLTRFPVPVILLALKCVKLAWDCIDFLRKYSRQCEPGTQEGQDELAERELQDFYATKGKGKPTPPAAVGGHAYAPPVQQINVQSANKYHPTPGNDQHV